MCGIAGAIEQGDVSQNYLTESLNALAHRGPDDRGSTSMRIDNAFVSLGQVRLSIIDLTTTGHQPMDDESEQYTIVFNGEIYNYVLLRIELLNLGHKFSSNSDTEVILKAYIEWGVKSVERFMGMFAFVIFDKQKKKLIIVRDRAGVKPLYYYWDGRTFLFASELKAFHCHPSFNKEINPEALVEYFTYGYIPAPRCIFNNSYKLQPGHYLEFDLNTSSYNITRYWTATDYYRKPIVKMSFNDAIDGLEATLKDAFSLRMVSDVPVGVFLSGGYDSASVTALLQANSMNKLKTFTIGFDEKYLDEAPFAKLIAEHLGTDHHECYCSIHDAKKIIPELSEIFDEPFADSSALPTVLISRFSRQHVKVALSADGGDELFSGYPSFQKVLGLFHRLKSVPNYLSERVVIALKSSKALVNHLPIYNAKGKLFKYIEILSNKNHLDQIMLSVGKYYYPQDIRELLGRESIPYITNLTGITDELNELLCLTYQMYLTDDIMCKVDRATMSVGLEGREPFLDHRILEYVASLPTEFKLNNGTSKYILKQLVHKYIPESVMNRPKQGFSVPMDTWLRTDLHPLIDEYILDGRKLKHGLFNRDYIVTMVNQLDRGYGNSHQLWLLLVFQMWYEKWMF